MILAIYSVFKSHTHTRTHTQDHDVHPSGDMTSYCCSQTGYLDFATFSKDFCCYIMILLCIPRDKLTAVNINIKVFLFVVTCSVIDKHKL
jgi:hypothetical protein